MSQPSLLRLRALRIVYGLNFFGLGFMAWSSLISPRTPWGLMDGVAVSFWAALALLMGLGMKYPLQMLPLLLLQLSYKIVWVAGVAGPLWFAGQWSPASTRFALNFIIPIVLDALIIPWPYVVARYTRAPAEGRASRESAAAAGPPTARSN